MLYILSSENSKVDTGWMETYSGYYKGWKLKNVKNKWSVKKRAKDTQGFIHKYEQNIYKLLTWTQEIMELKASHKRWEVAHFRKL